MALVKNMIDLLKEVLCRACKAFWSWYLDKDSVAKTQELLKICSQAVSIVIAILSIFA